MIEYLYASHQTLDCLHAFELERQGLLRTAVDHSIRKNLTKVFYFNLLIRQVPLVVSGENPLLVQNSSLEELYLLLLDVQLKTNVAQFRDLVVLGADLVQALYLGSVL